MASRHLCPMPDCSKRQQIVQSLRCILIGNAMKKEISDKLDGIFAQRDVKDAQIKQASTEKDEKEKSFLQAFYAQREAVMKPAMVEMQSLLAARGYETRIASSDERVEPNQRVSSRASITFLVVMGKQTHRQEEMPSLSINAAKSKQNVWYHRNTMAPGRGGASYSLGEASLDEVTEDAIQEKIVDLVNELLK